MPLESASKESIPLPEKRSKDDEHKPISMTLKSVSLINAFDGLRFGLSGILIDRDLYLPDMIFNLYYPCRLVLSCFCNFQNNLGQDLYN